MQLALCFRAYEGRATLAHPGIPGRLGGEVEDREVDGAGRTDDEGPSPFGPVSIGFNVPSPLTTCPKRRAGRSSPSASTAGGGSQSGSSSARAPFCLGSLRPADVPFVLQNAPTGAPRQRQGPTRSRMKSLL